MEQTENYRERMSVGVPNYAEIHVSQRDQGAQRNRIKAIKNGRCKYEVSTRTADLINATEHD